MNDKSIIRKLSYKHQQLQIAAKHTKTSSEHRRIAKNRDIAIKLLAHAMFMAGYEADIRH